MGGAGASLCKSLDFPHPDLLSSSICPAPGCFSFPHTLIHLHKRCRLRLYQSCNFRHVKLTLVVFFLSSGNLLPFPTCYPGPLWPLFHTTCYQSEMFAHNNWKQKVKFSSYINDQCFITSCKCEPFFSFLRTGYNIVSWVVPLKHVSFAWALF